MTLPRTLTPARRAIVAALTSNTGHALALSERLFVLLPVAKAAAQASKIKGSPSVWVSPIRNLADDRGLRQQATTHAFGAQVEITVSYWSGDPKSESELDACQCIIEADGPRIVAALCEPGALDTDPNGLSTGITGGQLLRDGYASRGPEPWPIESARVVTVTHLFPLHVELSLT